MYPFQGAQPATRLVCEVLLAMAMLSRQVPIVKRASSPVALWVTRAGTPAPHFLAAERHGSWNRLHSNLLRSYIVAAR